MCYAEVFDHADNWVWCVDYEQEAAGKCHDLQPIVMILLTKLH